MPHLRLAAFALLPVLAGCLIDTSTDRDGVELVQPGDIPVPHGLKIVDGQHESHTNSAGTDGAYRFENLIYEGKTPPVEVAAFLMQRMPMHSYRLVSQSNNEKGDEILVFQRGRYTSECTVRRLDYRTRLEVRVRTDLTDKQRP